MQDKPAGISFASLSEHLLEERLEARAKEDFYSDNKELFEGNVEKKIHAVLEGDFTAQTAKALRKILRFTVSFFAQCRWIPLKRNVRICLHTPDSFEKKGIGRLAPDARLPSAAILETGERLEVLVVLPVGIARSEEVINTLRLLASELPGQLYFEEKVPYRFPYANLETARKPASNDEERVMIYRFLELKDGRMEALIFKLCQGKGVPKALIPQAGIGELSKEMGKNRKFAESVGPLLKNVLENREDAFFEDGGKILRAARLKILKNLRRLGLILPHETATFEALANRDDWKFFYVVEERMRSAVAFAEQLTEIRKVIQKDSAENSKPPNPEEREKRPAQIEATIRSLENHPAVFPYLRDSGELDAEEKLLNLQFPLWIAANVLPQWKDKKTFDRKTAQEIGRRYRDSFFQRLYRLSLELKKMTGKNILTDREKEDALQKIRVEIGYFDFNSEICRDILCVCSYLETLWNHRKGSEGGSKKKALERFKAAWKYLQSFIIIRHYYLHIMKRGKENERVAEKFELRVMAYLSGKVAESVEYGLAAILIFAYKKLDGKVFPLRNLIENSVPFFDRHVLEPETALTDRSLEALKRKGELLAKVLLELREG